MTRKRKPGPGRGGHREGTPGQAYANRTDLTQAPSAAPHQTYGTAASQLRAQQVAPLPMQAPPPAPGPGGAAPAPAPAVGAGGAPAPPPPGVLGPLDAPSNRPGEPLTAGLNGGPGPGPEALQGPAPLTPIDEVRAMYAADPNDDMLRLLSYLDQPEPQTAPLVIPFAKGNWSGQRRQPVDPTSWQGPNGQLVPDVGQHDMGRKKR